MESQIIIELDSAGRLALAVKGAAQGSIVTALGMIETAKAMLVAQQQAKQPVQEPSRILAASGNGIPR